MPKKEQTPIIIDNSDKVIGFIGKMIELVKKHGVASILLTALLVGLLSVFFYFLFNPNVAFDVYERYKKTKHSELMDIRMQNAPKIQMLLDKLTFKVDASRSLILELHNGNDGVGGLPFTKCSATYEALSDETSPVASQYQNQNMSLIPFASFIFDENYWCGNVEDLKEIDKALYYKMKSNKTEHFAAHVIKGIDKPLAILIVSFEKVPNLEEHDCEKIHQQINKIAMEIAIYLEVEKLLKIKK